MHTGSAPNESSRPPRTPTDDNDTSPRVRQRTRARKRKRMESGSSSEEEVTELPENSLEVDRKLHETAVRNNLTDDSVKKILKKVVTNDHVLALVKLREEEEVAREGDEQLAPKLTRAKAKEMTRMSPTSTAPWRLALTPIKHIPVKTRPEVTALIAHDMPDESDEEYQPTCDDVMGFTAVRDRRVRSVQLESCVQSDDEPTLESCSDVDSQPRTPAPPNQVHASPPHHTATPDGIFKLPESRAGSQKTRRDSEEEATIARRTRSKLCLSATPIESIEQSFVPPDDLPALTGEVDDLWSNFLEEVLDPTTSHNEEDDEADPEYNAAADADADDEDEEGLERSLVNISKKEIDDLFNELLSMTEPALADQKQPAQQQQVSAGKPHSESSESKTEPTTKDVAETVAKQLPFPTPIKVEPLVPVSDEESSDDDEEEPQPPRILLDSVQRSSKSEVVNIIVSGSGNTVVEEVVCGVGGGGDGGGGRLPRARKPRLLRCLPSQPAPPTFDIPLHSDKGTVIEPQQVLILEQQLRQHVQLATSNFLQLYAHPRLWTYAPMYKDYLTSLSTMAARCAARGARSVVDVCNLQPAIDLLASWELALSEDTPSNRELVKYLEAESEKCMKRNVQNMVYAGSFHNMLMETVANSCVFVYPYLLPAMPYRCDSYRRTSYTHSEDCLLALGLEQFYSHVESNRSVYQTRKGGVTMSQVMGLIVQHMLPWFTPRSVKYHVNMARKSKHRDNPIREFFEKRKVRPVQHKLLSFNPNITLYDQPEYEMPLQWVKFISKHSVRAKEFTMRKARMRGHEPVGVDVDMVCRETVEPPTKVPVPAEQTNPSNFIIRSLTLPDTGSAGCAETVPNTSLQVLRTGDGGLLLPVLLLPQGRTVNSTRTPIPSTRVAESPESELCIDEDARPASEQGDSDPECETGTPHTQSHCRCCRLLKEMRKRWPLITNYFTPVRRAPDTRECCVGRPQPRLTRRMGYFLSNYKLTSLVMLKELDSRIEDLDKLTSDQRTKKRKGDNDEGVSYGDSSEMSDKEELEDQLWVCAYLSKLSIRNPAARNARNKLFQLLSQFDAERDCPVRLYEQVTKELGAGMSDLALEFVGMLTAAQADRLGRYRDYFVSRHLRTYLRLVQEELGECKLAARVVRGVRAALAERAGGACELCCRLLRLAPRRRLAEFLFRVTPHAPPPPPPRRLPAHTDVQSVRNPPQSKPATVQNGKPSVPTIEIRLRPIAPKGGLPYEVEVKREARRGGEERGEVSAAAQQRPVSTGRLPNLNATDSLEIDTAELTVSKTEIVDESYCSAQSAASSPGEVDGMRLKLEPVDWSREEDKILLEAIQLYTKTVEATIPEVLEDEEIFCTVQDSLCDKTLEDIRERIDYLLLCVNGNR